MAPPKWAVGGTAIDLGDCSRCIFIQSVLIKLKIRKDISSLMFQRDVPVVEISMFVDELSQIVPQLINLRVSI